MNETGAIILALLILKSALEIIHSLIKKKAKLEVAPIVMSTDCYFPTDRTRDGKEHANIVRIGNHLKVPDIEV